MERLTISMSDDFAAELSAFMAGNQYENRSEAVRDLARLGLKRMRLDSDVAGDCIATLSYVFNHHTRELAKRLTGAHHNHHDIQVASMHVHLDHENCLEVAVLRGDAAAVRDFSNTVMAERGVYHGHVSLVPVVIQSAGHAHEHGEPAHKHAHTRPLT